MDSCTVDVNIPGDGSVFPILDLKSPVIQNIMEFLDISL